MKNIPVYAVCKNQYVIVLNDYFYVGVVSMVGVSCFSVTTT